MGQERADIISDMSQKRASMDQYRAGMSQERAGVG